MKQLLSVFALIGMLGGSPAGARGQSGPSFFAPLVTTNREVQLSLSGTKGLNYRIYGAANPGVWEAMIVATNGNGTVQYLDSATPRLGARFYRAEELRGKELTGDYVPGSGGNLLIHPIFHATMVIVWKDVTISVDPVANAGLNGMPAADLVLVTHEHTDHFNEATIKAVAKTNATVVVSKAVFPQLSASMKARATLMTNGATLSYRDISINAIPAYNGNHPKGNGNGYVLELGGKRIYISGDTDDIPEMRALQNIDVAFVCMDGQFNMGMPAASSAVRQFQPAVVFPYHYNSQNTATFKRLVGTDLPIEVRLRTWQ